MQLLKDNTHIDAFLPHVMAFAMGSEEEGMLPESVARSFIRNSIYKFAERTGILKERQTLSMQCGLACYPIEVGEDQTIIGIKSARMGDFETLDCSCNWSWGNVDFWIEDDSLHVYPTPSSDVEAGLEIELVLAPSRDACEVDSVFYNKWHDTIIHGALAEIHMMPSRPWSSVGRALERKRMFDDDVSRATIRKVMSEKREPMRMSPNQNFLFNRSSQRRW